LFLFFLLSEDTIFSLWVFEEWMNLWQKDVEPALVLSLQKWKELTRSKLWHYKGLANIKTILVKT
jgi:hypothetical protein